MPKGGGSSGGGKGSSGSHGSGGKGSSSSSGSHGSGGKGGSSSGSHHSSSGGSKMTPQDASRIQKAVDTNPNSPSAQSGFKERAQAAGAHNQN